MSKHKSSEEKLHVGQSIRPAERPGSKRKHISQNQLSPAPAKRSNTNNQYR